MSYTNAQGALNQYRKVGVHGGIADASPHRLIQMLLEGALERISTARGHMERGDMAQKGKLVGAAISIVDGLRAALDLEKGGEIAANLDNLYDYMGRRMLDANLKNDPTILDEVASLLNEIKGAWDAIPEELRGGASTAAAASNHG